MVFKNWTANFKSFWKLWFWPGGGVVNSMVHVGVGQNMAGASLELSWSCHWIVIESQGAGLFFGTHSPVVAGGRMPPKVTSELLRQLRQAMKNLEYVTEPIQAYIIPSGDAHQVLSGDGPVMELISLSSHFISSPQTKNINWILVVNPQLSISSRAWRRGLCPVGSHWMPIGLVLASLFAMNLSAFNKLWKN